MKYRREIDGLRAIAVLPVMLFHARLQPFSAGHLGVDVFFVISGYLITRLLISNMDRGDFSLWRFYERRARRILPALFVVTFTSIPFAWLWMQPSQFEDFGASLTAVALFFSNIFFWQHDSYFSLDSEMKPLLHTWSLAVEEQFYVIFPLLLMGLWRFERNRVLQIIIGIAITSLIVSEVGWRYWSSANFYLMPSRSFELLAGSICAFWSHSRPLRPNEILSALGLVMVVGAMVLFGPSTPVPSVYALPIVVGTALVILFGASTTYAGRLLASRPFVAIGLISYSAYLWHQPLFAFARIRAMTPVTPWFMLGLTCLALILAYLTWRFVEQPFRRRPNPLFSQQQVFALAALMSFGLAWMTVAFSIWNVPTALATAHPKLFRPESFQLAKHTACPGFDAVATGNAECGIYGAGDRLIAIWGDSHVVSLRYAISPIPGVRVMTINQQGCPPAAGLAAGPIIGDIPNCTRLGQLDRYLEYIISSNPSDVVLVGRWTYYLDGWVREGHKALADVYLYDSQTKTRGSNDETRAALQRGLERTIARLSPQTRVFMLSQPIDLSYMTGRARLFSNEVSQPAFAKFHANEVALELDLAAATQVQVIDVKPLFCSDESCLTRVDGWPLYFDDNHLLPRGEKMVWELIVASIIHQ